MKRKTALTHLFLVAAALAIALPVQAAGGSTPCAKNLGSCPTRGCAAPGTPDALVNIQKRTLPKEGAPVALTLDDLARLQELADQAVGQHVGLDAPHRKKLKGLSLSSRRVGEGDLVEITGYVVGRENHLPHANTSGESVNCRLKGVANNDFHIPIARTPDDSIYEAIVVEMIPQDRPGGWTVGKLKRVSQERRQVRVRGQLLYDNKHEVNDNPAEPIGGQPARFSLWEVHPVTEFLVCRKPGADCDPADGAQWQRLEEVP